jgi:small subunit ribosomal protein S4
VVSHRHVTVNGRTTNIPSFRVKPGDVIEIRTKSRDSQAVIGSLQVFGQRDVPGWLASDKNAFKVTVVDAPVRTQIDAPVSEQMIVELYSK